MKRNRFLLFVLLGVVAIIVWNFLSQPGVKDLKGDFKEISFVRNEQNDGPVIRVYAVSVSGEYWNEMHQYGDFMPHTKYGNTKVYFFKNSEALPTTLNLLEPQVPQEFQSACLAVYEKDGMSQVSFRKYPFK
ncbi:hypothetical protein Pedsa_2905 [Pseudopedobacter saltans DSM 12145]|uniref:Uncharacterized protein n=1 Tax=Pseudopedobacter saltans (strain ATCC 51119 / DSM 12145 / JCM 21818 / CCUG 39354 / LMG 10337 / NBRC 100064 / NCIMB 13643) TaxID=762903 RepID=F0S8V7_PSESL|nr:hypothetical protein [Pseudopedobacter saltans]ADY53444.1 hypothetical protein Pedsa_2905 [Pseudopedobacter saltans DSM 12145]